MSSLLWFFLACSSTEFDVSGNPDGAQFTAVSAYWGSQFIIFIDQEIDCIDMWWVQKFNLTNEEPPISRDLRALQITYTKEESISEGTYSLGGVAPIKTEFLDISGEVFTVSKSTEGVLELDEKINEKTITGGLNFVFSSGSVTGTFTDIAWCINIKP